MMRSTEEYAELAEEALEDATSTAVADQTREHLYVKAQVWASLAIAASNLEGRAANVQQK
jgi:hypothetical protein